MPLESSTHHKALVIGNGLSRIGIDLENYRSYTTFGCNAIHRDFVVDHLICYDKRMVDEVLRNTKYNNTNIYTREPWGRLKNLPNVSNPLLWGSGTFAILLAITLGYKKIYLLGYDLDSGNIYSGTDNYKNNSPADNAYWLQQLGCMIEDNEDIDFFFVNSKNGLSYPNLFFITKNELPA